MTGKLHNILLCFHFPIYDAASEILPATQYCVVLYSKNKGGFFCVLVLKAVGVFFLVKRGGGCPHLIFEYI